MAVQQKPPAAGSALFERTPPQSIEAERAVLGAMLINADSVGVALEILGDQPGDTFYVEAHQHIYQAMLDLYRQSMPVDGTTLTEQLSRSGKLEAGGGFSYLGELAGAVPTSANIEYYARIVLDAAVLRRLISACTRVVGDAYKGEGEVSEMLDRAESEIFAIAEKRQLNPIHTIGDLLEDGIHRIEAQMQARSGITGLPTGYYELDELLAGLQNSDMVVLAARPSVGKTAFALNIATHAATQHGKGALIFSLEMAKEQLVQRIICMEGKVNSRRLREGFLQGDEFKKVTQAAATLSKAPIYIDESASISALELRSKARRLANNYKNLGLVVIDYMQLMRGSSRSENRQVEISEISRSIKGIARELRVPVLALSQLSREAEKDDSGMPKLSHLRESGAIEQDADVVLMLSRLPAAEREGRENIIRVSISKQRNGPTGMIDLLFERDIQRFYNLAEQQAPRKPKAPPAGTTPSTDYDIYDEDDDAFEDEDEAPF